MMANKKLKLNEMIVENIDNEYELRRDSFSDRFCDDLLELILNYLSVEEKIRFECVSKQWKKLIFNKQKNLGIFDCNEVKDNLFKLLKVLTLPQTIVIESDGRFANLGPLLSAPFRQSVIITTTYSIKNNLKVYEIEIKTLENVLKKFKFLNHLLIDGFVLKNKSDVLNAVTDNCDYLKSIEFDFQNIDRQTLNKFGLKFGQQLKEIYFLDDFSRKGFVSGLSFEKSTKKSIIKMFPNLLVINNLQIKDLVKDKEVLVKSVTKLMSCKIKNEDLFCFKLFAENNCNTIEMIDINPHFYDDIQRTDFLKQISVMKKLKVLKIDFDEQNCYSESLTDKMKLIADNCKQLKKLKFAVFGMNLFEKKQTFESFTNFKSLTKLSFCINWGKKEEELNEFRIDCLKNCKLLTHLRLRIEEINDNFFDGIDSIVPQLKQLRIETEKVLSDKALDSISKLKHLKQLSLGHMWYEFEYKLITDLGLICVINNCQDLESIFLIKRPNITHKTIEALIEKALKNPRIYFNHYLSSINKESDGFTTIDLKSYSSLPINLKIRA